MRSPLLSLCSVLALPSLLAGCGGPASAPASAPPAPANTKTHADLIRQARDAFDAARFAEAASFARRAAALAPADSDAWALYRQAAVAQAGDNYLQTLPPHRYRLSMKSFLKEYHHDPGYWFLLDVRTPDEFAGGHIEGAVNIPLRGLMQHLDELPADRTAPILLYCHSQKRSTHALVILHELGYVNVYNLEGGYAAYQEWTRHEPPSQPHASPQPDDEEKDFGC